MRKKEQRILGIALLGICAVIVLFALHGNTVEERDITPVLFCAPLGLFLLFYRGDWDFGKEDDEWN